MRRLFVLGCLSFVFFMGYSQLTTISANDSFVINEFERLFNQSNLAIPMTVIFDDNIDNDLTITFVETDQNFISFDIVINNHLSFLRQKQMFIIALMRAKELLTNSPLKSWSQLIILSQNQL